MNGQNARQHLYFLYPQAIAAHANELFIFDSGHGMIFRFDQTRNVLDVFAHLLVSNAEVDLYVDADLSVYVADSHNREVRQYDWQGSLVQRYRNKQNLPQPVAVIVAPGDANILVADGLRAIVLAFNRLGSVTWSLGARVMQPVPFRDIVAMARDQEQTFIVDQLGQLVHAFGPGQRLHAVFGEDNLEQPESIAVDDYRRVFVVDRFDNTIKVFRDAELQAVIGGNGDVESWFQNVLDLWYSDGFIYVADGANARVSIFHVLPPCE
jgi:DNA-binding beta-propeller fold protein YncE